MRERHSVCDVEATLVLLLEGDVGWLLVDSDAEPFQLGLDDPLVRERLVHVEHNEDEVTCLCHRDDLPSSATAVLGTFDDTRQVDDLQGGA